MPDLGPAVAAHGSWVLALSVLLENAGVPVPGETALLAAGYLSSGPGGHHLHLWAVVATAFPTAFPAAVLGDNLGFLLGRTLARPRLASGKGFVFLTPARMTVAEACFARHGLPTVFAARFITVLRVVAGPAASAAGMAWPRFVAANAAGAMVWAVVGYTAGHTWAALRELLGAWAWVVVGVGLGGVFAWWAVRRRERKVSGIPTGSDGGTAGRDKPDSL